MRGWIAGMLLTALAATPAFAQGSKPAPQAQQKPAQKPAEQKPAEQKPAEQNAGPATVEKSAIAGVAFAERPFPLKDDGTYASFMAPVASEIGRTCGGLESFGWEFGGLDTDKAQERADRVFQTTMRGFKDAGYAINEVTSTVAEPGLAAYTADQEKKQLLLFWAPVTDAIILLLCENGPKK